MDEERTPFLPLVSSQENAELEEFTAEHLHISKRLLMENAGREVGRVAKQYLDTLELQYLNNVNQASYAPKAQVVIACGKGNNGGDGLVTARALLARGVGVKVYIFGDSAKYPEPSSAAYSALKQYLTHLTKETLPTHKLREITQAGDLAEFITDLQQSHLVIEALLGSGFKGEIQGLFKEVINCINQHSLSTLSIDIPAGVHSDTGSTALTCIQAHRTLTFNFAKYGHYLYPGAGKCGRVEIADIGLAWPKPPRVTLAVEENTKTLLPPRNLDAHKGTCGHVVIVGGSLQTPGAAILAAEGALKSGAGLVSLVTEPSICELMPIPPEILLRLRPQTPHDILKKAEALVIGPGLSIDLQQEVGALLDLAKIPLCLDATALNMLAQNPALLPPTTTPRLWIITPHPQEAARLLDCSVQDIQQDRLAAAKTLAQKYQCVTLLKGAGSIVCGPTESGTYATTIIGEGTPALAKGGSGDVLSGIIGGLLAQFTKKLPREPWEQLRQLTIIAAVLHAKSGVRAASSASILGTLARDLLTGMGNTLINWQR